MSNASGSGDTVAATEDPEKKKKTQLEDKSKDDLVKLVKKQLILLQKAKGKGDELSQRCSILEEENENHVKKNQELLDNVQCLEAEISNLKIENESKEDEMREEKMSELKVEIEKLTNEKHASFITLNEKNEQIDCLSMQLETVQQTCRYLQEELTKYQQCNKEMEEKIKMLSDANEASFNSLKQSDEKNIFCNEEICKLSSKVKELEQLIDDLQSENRKLLSENSQANKEATELKEKIKSLQDKQCNEDINFLIADNQKLISELKESKYENNKLKDVITSFQNTDRNIEDPQKSQNSEHISRNDEQLAELQKALCEVENAKSKIINEKNILEEENKSMLLEVKQLKISKEELVSKLEQSEKEKLNLEKEIRKLSSLFNDVEDFKTSFEFALLHGGEIESFKKNEPHVENIHITNKQDVVDSEMENKSFPQPVIPDDGSCFSEGFEYALLSGGYVPSFIEAHLPSEELQTSSEDTKNETDGKQSSLTLANQTNNDVPIQSQVEIISKKLESYRDTLKEICCENESLKLQLEIYENEKSKSIDCVDVGTNTNSEILLKSYHEEKLHEYDKLLEDLKKENSDLLNKITTLESKLSNSICDHDSLSNEFNILKSNLELSVNKIQSLEAINTKLETEQNVLEKQNVEISEKLTNSLQEFSNLNSNLDQFLSNAIQTIDQMPDISYIATKMEFPHTLNNLTLLFENLVSSCSENYSNVKDLEMELENINNQRVELEEKICHTEELNRFLEEEVKALQDELENIKCTPHYFAKNYETVYENKCSSELYSIEEINEAEEKGISSDSLAETLSDSPVSETNVSGNKDVSSPSQIFCDIENSKLCIDKSTQEERIDCSNRNCELLRAEHLGLKQSLDDKSKEITELINESHKQAAEVLSLKNIISELEITLQDLKSKNNSFKDDLNSFYKSIIDLKVENTELKSNFAFLSGKEYDTFVRNINQYLALLVQTADIEKEKYLSLETQVKDIKLYFNNMSKDFNLLSNLLEHLNEEEHLDNQLEILQKVSLKSFFDFHEIMNSSEQDTRYNILNDITGFDLNKQRMISALCKYLNSTKQSLSKLKNQLDDPKIEKVTKEVEVAIKQESSSNEEANILTQLHETELKLKKLKQLSMKWKKELEDSKKQCQEIKLDKEKVSTELNEIRKELQHYMQNYQSLQTEYDKSQDELELQKGNLKKLQEDFATTLLELNAHKEKMADADSQIAKSKDIIEANVFAKQEAEKMYVDLEGKLIVAESKYDEMQNKIRELENKIEEKQETIVAITNESNNLKLQLSQAQKDESKKTLMDLEMADYERSVSELNTKLQSKENEISELQQKLHAEIDKNESLLEEIKSTEKLKETEENRAINLKEILENTKAELMTSKEEQASLSSKVSSLQLQLEILTQQEENYKLQLSESAAEIQHLKEMVKMSTENHQRIVHLLESKISTQKQEILCSHKEVETLKQEFENYKVRVHSVLRQQKSSTTTIPPIEVELKEKFDVIVDKLRTQVKDLSEKLTAVNLEQESLQDEYESLLERYNQAIEEKSKKDSEWHSRLEQINAEKNQLRLAQEELTSQHLLQNEMLVSTYKKQIKIMSEEHKITVNELQKQLESADLEIARLQRDQQKINGSLSASQESSFHFDILSQERQECEGSECTDGASTPIHPLSLSTIPTSGFMSFEKLLQSPLEPETPTIFTQCSECEKLISNLQVANKKIDHISEVLNDSESSNLRMSEQVRVLKEEVRRLERNKEREQHAENLEYLKNVFLKFSLLHPSAEKTMLIPVLTTMLKLSPSEQQQLKNVAGNADINENADSGWGSYLHRWSGLG